jgi:serine/threonine protein kinase
MVVTVNIKHFVNKWFIEDDFHCTYKVNNDCKLCGHILITICVYILNFYRLIFIVLYYSNLYNKMPKSMKQTKRKQKRTKTRTIQRSREVLYQYGGNHTKVEMTMEHCDGTRFGEILGNHKFMLFPYKIREEGPGCHGLALTSTDALGKGAFNTVYPLEGNKIIRFFDINQHYIEKKTRDSRFDIEKPIEYKEWVYQSLTTVLGTEIQGNKIHYYLSKHVDPEGKYINKVYEMGVYQIINEDRFNMEFPVLGTVPEMEDLEAGDRKTTEILQQPVANPNISLKELRNNKISLETLIPPERIEVPNNGEWVGWANGSYSILGKCYGDLYNKMVKPEISRHIKWDKMKKLLFNITSAIKRLHDNHYVHRDIKLENILLKYENEYTEIRLADFGFTAYVSPDNISELSKQCGTPDYFTQELWVKQKYDERNYENVYNNDIYAMGILFTELIFGENIMVLALSDTERSGVKAINHKTLNTFIENFFSESNKFRQNLWRKMLGRLSPSRRIILETDEGQYVYDLIKGMLSPIGGRFQKYTINDVVTNPFFNSITRETPDVGAAGGAGGDTGDAGDAEIREKERRAIAKHRRRVETDRLVKLDEDRKKKRREEKMDPASRGWSVTDDSPV